jgi:ADP-ribose pyrophosphatase YjhB (NUDIX family)
MKQAVRAIVIKDNQLLVMHRNKFGQQYYTLVGGGVELGESLDMALMREIGEETGLQVANPRLVYIEEAEEMYGTQYVYLCDYAGGEVTLSPQSEEAQINQLGQNLYQPMWLPLAQLPEAPFVSPGLKQRILTAVQQGWPAAPEHFQHTQTTLQ